VQQFRHRAYDPGTGTWIQEDPLGVAGGVNVYQYNNGNPVSFSDAFGLVAADSGQAGVDTCKTLVREFSVGISGLAGVGLLGSPFLGGGVSIGGNSSGQFFVRFTASASAGVGTFGGVGASLGTGRSSGPLRAGLSTQTSAVAHANAGLGYSTGGSVTASARANFGASGSPFVRFGAGWGAQASVGVQREATISSPSLFGRSCEPSKLR
jgi:hypothetical protein